MGIRFHSKLCIALAHRWEPERLFCDRDGIFGRSGTHDGSPVMVIGRRDGDGRSMGALPDGPRSPSQDVRFQDFPCQRSSIRTGGVCRVVAGKAFALIGGMTDLCAQTTMHALVFSVRRSEYQAEYRLSDGPRKMRLDTEYALAFRMCLVNMIGYLLGQGWPLRTGSYPVERRSGKRALQRGGRGARVR